MLWFTQARMGWTLRVMREGTGVWVGGSPGVGSVVPEKTQTGLGFNLG